MKQQVIQDFLNLPGVTGIALMDGRSRPYFHGVDQSLNFQQKEALSQGILQVVATTPAGFESFEFQFTEHQVHIYKLKQGMILLVLTGSQLVYADYLTAIAALKTALQDDLATSILTFRTLARQPNAVNGAALPQTALPQSGAIRAAPQVQKQVAPRILAPPAPFQAGPLQTVLKQAVVKPVSGDPLVGKSEKAAMTMAAMTMIELGAPVALGDRRDARNLSAVAPTNLDKTALRDIDPSRTTLPSTAADSMASGSMASGSIAPDSKATGSAAAGPVSPLRLAPFAVSLPHPTGDRPLSPSLPIAAPAPPLAKPEVVPTQAPTRPLAAAPKVAANDVKPSHPPLPAQSTTPVYLNGQIAPIAIAANPSSPPALPGNSARPSNATHAPQPGGRPAHNGAPGAGDNHDSSYHNTDHLGDLLVDHADYTGGDVTLRDMLAALNHLSEFTRRYLGTSIIVNYWRTTCPAIAWLNNFQVDRAAQFSFNRTTAQKLYQLLTEEEQAWIKTWVAAFIARCAIVIRDYAEVVDTQALNEHQKFLLRSEHWPDDSPRKG